MLVTPKRLPRNSSGFNAGARHQIVGHAIGQHRENLQIDTGHRRA